MNRFRLAICFCLFLPLTLLADQPSGGTVLVKDFASLLKLLNEDGVTHQTHMKDSAVSIPTEKGPIDGVFVIRWDAEQGFAHFIQPFMMPIPKEKIADMEGAMMRLNHAIPYPGLGINHETGHPYFRMSIAVLGEGLSAADVRRYFSHTLAQAAKWHPEVKSVLEGAPPNQIVERYNATQFPAGRFVTKVIGSRWTLNFDGEESLTLHRDGQEVVQSTYEIRGNLIRFVDRGYRQVLVQQLLCLPRRQADRCHGTFGHSLHQRRARRHQRYRIRQGQHP